MTAYFILGGLIGAIAASLAVLVADRLQDGRRLFWSRSGCDHCQKPLPWFSLIPILSWFVQAGRSHCCRQRLGWHYPLTEIAAGLVFAVWFGLGDFSTGAAYPVWGLIFWGLILTGLIVLFVSDFRWQILPTKVIQIIFWGLLLGQSLTIIATDQAFGPEILRLGLSLWAGGLLFYGLYWYRQDWIGFGDVRLGACLGLLLGNGYLILATLFCGGLIGLLGVGFVWLSTGKRPDRHQKIAFGPCLISAAIIVFLAQNHIIERLYMA